MGHTATEQTASGGLTATEHRLANGLRVVLSEDHLTPVAAVCLWYDVGSRHEVTGRTGLAQDIGERFEDRALACARDALDRDDAVVRAKQQTPCPFLSSVQGQAIFDLGQGLQTGPGKVGRNNRRRSAAPVFDPSNDALFEADSIACREQFPVGAPALLQMSLSE